MNGEKAVICGFVEDIVFRNAENGYTVFDISNDGVLITVVGCAARISAGEEVRIKGEWTMHPTFGQQFKADEIETKIPESAADMLRYLSSGAIKGIGPATAMKIVDRFADDTFEVLENRPDLLSTIKGITQEKAEKISKDFKNQFAVREVMIHLEKFGMKSSECIAAYEAYGMNAIVAIRENPYLLCGDKIGLSFERAQEIADNFGFDSNSDYKKRAGVIYIIKRNLGNGHTCLPKEKIIPVAAEFLQAQDGDIERITNELVEDKELVEKQLDGRAFLFLPRIYHAEKNISERIKVMLSFPPVSGRSVDKDIDDIEKENAIHFEEKQRLAITTAVKKGLLVLTGGPGTGKTTTLNGILSMYEKRKLRVLLAAPTGRAAKRMSEVTGREAKTIHRLLEVKWGENNSQKFNRNMQNPLECDALIVDELSMVDVLLFEGLLDALPLGCRLIMVGDSDQLPPVGAGNVLDDIIKSQLLPVVSLTQVFRQSLESLIVENAHKIVSGQYPELSCTQKDFFFLPRENLLAAATTVIDLYSNRLPKAYGCDSVSDIQIICPSRKGELGTVKLNQSLQKLINPPSADKEELKIAGRIFREGDKVMQIKNNYDIFWTKGRETSTGVFNGDIGIITAVNHNNQTVKILFDEQRTAVYAFENMKELEHAYAITVHKSQGSEFENVIIPMCGVPPLLSYRNLLYTAVTRAKNRLVIVGSKSQVQQMVDNDKKTKRYSALQYFLKETNAL